MLTRLRVSGFKNLVDVDVRFGPFTCIAGANAAGKSNLFDAIRFLGLLSEHTLLKSAGMLRGSADQSFDVRDLFYTDGKETMHEMHFEADIIIPSEGEDDSGRVRQAIATFMRYSLSLALDDQQSLHPLILKQEDLIALDPKAAFESILFPRSEQWYESIQSQSQVYDVRDDGSPIIPDTFIMTADGTVTITAERIGVPIENVAARLTKTVLASANSTLHPTAYLVQQEMRSWQHILLEPSALRMPDSFADANEHNQVGADGRYLPATLYDITIHDNAAGWGKYPDHDALYARLSNRLNELIGGIRKVEVKRNDEAQQLSLVITNRQGVKQSPRAISDGTLRFLAYAIMLEDRHPGVLCIEEPENGLHPQRIPALLRLLQDIAMDTRLPLGDDNPLRQVIISTHSPLVVSYVPDDSLVYVRSVLHGRGHQRTPIAYFQWLPDTWRGNSDTDPAHIVAPGDILTYLNPVVLPEAPQPEATPERRVIDRPNLWELLSVQEEISSD